MFDIIYLYYHLVYCSIKNVRHNLFILPSGLLQYGTKCSTQSFYITFTAVWNKMIDTIYLYYHLVCCSMEQNVRHNLFILPSGLLQYGTKCSTQSSYTTIWFTAVAWNKMFDTIYLYYHLVYCSMKQNVNYIAITLQ